MSKQSKTPRTDAKWPEFRGGPPKWVDFARELETELAAKTEEARRLREALEWQPEATAPLNEGPILAIINREKYPSVIEWKNASEDPDVYSPCWCYAPGYIPIRARFNCWRRIEPLLAHTGKDGEG